jgi:hypothetical protein
VKALSFGPGNFDRGPRKTLYMRATACCAKYAKITIMIKAGLLNMVST